MRKQLNQKSVLFYFSNNLRKSAFVFVAVVDEIISDDDDDGGVLSMLIFATLFCTDLGMNDILGLISLQNKKIQ